MYSRHVEIDSSEIFKHQCDTVVKKLKIVIKLVNGRKDYWNQKEVLSFDAVVVRNVKLKRNENRNEKSK